MAIAYKPRMSGEARKRQIVDVTVGLVAKYGVPGTTMSRIAEAAGISKAAVYEQFKSRHEVLLAALDAVFACIFEINGSGSHPNAIERLREVGRYNTQLLTTQTTPYVYALLEFIAAPPEAGLRNEIGLRQRAAAHDLAQVVEDGKRQGLINPGVDSEHVAWMMAGWAWTEGISHLIGAADFWDPKHSADMLDTLLQGILTTEHETADSSPTEASTVS
jgi:TetR/AcrR family transcriptional regulator